MRRFQNYLGGADLRKPADENIEEGHSPGFRGPASGQHRGAEDSQDEVAVVIEAAVDRAVQVKHTSHSKQIRCSALEAA